MQAAGHNPNQTGRHPENLETLLPEVARLLKRRLDRDARASGLTGARWRVLAHLRGNEGISQAAVSVSLRMAPIGVVRIVDHLQQAGLVERRKDSKDRRAWLLHLTPQARCRLEEVDRLRHSARDEFFKGISDTDCERFGAMLRRLKANLDPAETTSP